MELLPLDRGSRDFSEGGGLYRPFATEQLRSVSTIGAIGWLVASGVVLAGFGVLLYAAIWVIQ